MSNPGWNLHFNPPGYGKYTNEEVTHELISSAKAFYNCRKVAKAFSDCRKMPLGYAVEPESCLDLSYSLQDCYNEVKKVPKNCEFTYNSTVKCLNTPNEDCETNLQKYINCENPSLEKYKFFDSNADIS